MGLFSSKKIITVSSTLYNMAGDEDDQPDFLKGALFGAVMADSPSLADEITGSYFEGPGQKQLQFFRFCQQVNYSEMPTASVVNSNPLDSTIVGGQIPLTSVPPAPTGLEIYAYQAFVADGDFEPWIEKWILANYPERISEEWLGEYEPSTETFSIEFPNNDFFSFPNDGSEVPLFSSLKRYVVAKYIEFSEDYEDDIIEGTPTTGETSLPDVTGWDQISDTSTFTNVTLQRTRTTVKSYNNGDPDVTTEDAVDADISDTLNTAEEVYTQDVVVSQNGIEMQGERQWWYFTGTDTVVGGYSNTVVTQNDLGGGVIETVTSTTTGEQVQETWTTQYDTQDLFIGKQYGPEQIFIYEVGTGNSTLDDLVNESDASGFQEFFPFVPVRINNVSITNPVYENLYDENSNIYRRGFPGKQFSELVDIVEDNPSLEDIDYAYLCWGTSLNAKDNTAKMYTYDFFKKLIPFQRGGSGSVISEFIDRVTNYNQALQALELWEQIYGDQNEEIAWRDISSRPTIPTLNLPPTNTIRLRDGGIGIDYRITWIHAEEEQFNGTFEVLPNIDARIKDCKMEVGSSITWQERQTYNTRAGEDIQYITNTIPSMKIYRQIDESTYRVMTIWGLVSQNYIYGGKAVTITSTEALNDSEESGFLVPLHYPTMLDMNIVDYTQLCTSNSHILFNSYEVTKQKWYQRSLFKIFLVIAIIIIAVVVFPGAFAGGGGILGGNLAVGTALGLTGTAALVAGVVANYIAAIIIAEVLKIVGTELFGEKWGALFAVIAGFALGATISGTSLFSAEGLLGLGNSLANGYAGWVQGDIAEMQEDWEDDNQSYEERIKYIQDLIEGLDGNNDLNFDPRFFTQGQRGNRRSDGYTMETAEQFIRRTTMTGGDVVELTHSMVFDYVDIARTLPRNV